MQIICTGTLDRMPIPQKELTKLVQNNPIKVEQICDPTNNFIISLEFCDDPMQYSEGAFFKNQDCHSLLQDLSLHNAKCHQTYITMPLTSTM